MDQDTRIAKLEAEVAALHLFVISLRATGTGGEHQKEFEGNAGALENALIGAGKQGSAERLQEAVGAINGHSITHLVR